MDQKQKAQEVWNKYGSTLKNLSNNLNLNPAISAAILCVESNGTGFSPDGRMIIRFENHIFWRYWGKDNAEEFNKHFKFDPNKKWLGHQFRKDVNRLWVSFHDIGQNGEWEAFNFASSFSEQYAMFSISMGMPQIMGFNYGKVGCLAVKLMFQTFSCSEENQINGMFNFIDSTNGAVLALQQEDFVKFATLYNGSGQAYVYGEKIHSYYDIFREIVNV